jgi:hypothetical protein
LLPLKLSGVKVDAYDLAGFVNSVEAAVFEDRAVQFASEIFVFP